MRTFFAVLAGITGALLTCDMIEPMPMYQGEGLGWWLFTIIAFSVSVIGAIAYSE